MYTHTHIHIKAIMDYVAKRERDLERELRVYFCNYMQFLHCYNPPRKPVTYYSIDYKKQISLNNKQLNYLTINDEKIELNLRNIQLGNQWSAKERAAIFKLIIDFTRDNIERAR